MIILAYLFVPVFVRAVSLVAQNDGVEAGGAATVDHKMLIFPVRLEIEWTTLMIVVHLVPLLRRVRPLPEVGDPSVLSNAANFISSHTLCRVQI